MASHYDTLEVSPLASPEVIRAAYRSLIQRFHPDRNPGDPAAAARASEVAIAYGVLSDPQKRASYDAGLQAAAPSEMPAASASQRDPGAATPRARHGRTAHVSIDPVRPPPSRGWGFELGIWSLAIVALVGAVFLFRSLATRNDPVAELAMIRATMSSGASPEAEKRRLYARKTAILEEHPELLQRESAERSEDMAARTFPLLGSPLVVRLSRPPPASGPPIELTVPAISLVVGRFDSQNLVSRMTKHRERLVQDIAERLVKQDPAALGRPDGEQHVKRIVADAVAASLEINAAAEYPSTYFESPGRYGVVNVLLPGRISLVQLESPP